MQLYSESNLNVFNLTGLHFNHLDVRYSAKLSNAAVKGISELKLEDCIQSTEAH